MTVNIVHMNPAVPGSASSSVLQYITSISKDKRTIQCPVRTKYWGKISSVEEFLIPISKISTDIISQARTNGKNGAVVSSLSKQMRVDGQNLGICCLVKKNKSGQWEIIIRWGSHRWNAAQMLESIGEPILHAPPGYMWVSIYNQYHQPMELNKLQTIENNLVEAKEPAKQEDNLQSLHTAWRDGDLNLKGIPFAALSQKEQEASLKKWIKTYCCANVKRPGTLVKEFFAAHSQKVRTDTKTKLDHQNHWNLHESALFNVKFEKAGKKANQQLDKKGKTHAQYHMLADTLHGATVQQMIDAKFSLTAAGTPNVDVIHLVVSLPLPKLTTLSDRINARKIKYDDVVHQNSLFANLGKKLVDYLYIMPQTAQEESAAASGASPWVSRYKM